MTPRTIRALIAMFVAAVIVIPSLAYLSTQDDAGLGLETFPDYPSFASFLEERREAQFLGWGPVEGPTIATGTADTGFSFERGGDDYSGTNVQVEGIDELDTVKTDGSHVFVSTYDGLSIIRAVPASGMQVVKTLGGEDLLRGNAELTFSGVTGMLLDDDVLVVVVRAYEPARETAPDTGFWYPGTSYTVVVGFDVSVPDAPHLLFTHAVSGSAWQARLADGHAYVIVQDWIWKVEDTWQTPSVCDGSLCTSMAPSDIGYDPDAVDASSFTSILAVRLSDGAAEVETILSGQGTTVYMTFGWLYLTVTTYAGGWWARDGGWSEPEVTTSIYKVRVDGLDLRAVAKGEVPGWLLNQFSMDEHEGFLRVATTTGWQEPTNAVYVLDEGMDTVGELEGLAPTERIFAARFLGDTLYLVTFRQIDPFFVIDLSDPWAPEVVGELKIPGFSSYLHPWGEGLVLGIGQEDWGVKVSLFDVTDPADPREASTYRIEGHSYSPALHDHHAVLADVEREMLVLPVNGGWTPEGPEPSGAYVFAVDGGIALRGVVEHEADWVQRSLYIGDVLYTVGGTSVTASELSDLSEVATVVFGAP